MEDRIHIMNTLPRNPEGNYILYWMQAAQRIEHNYALGLAIETANKMSKPLLVVFALTAYPEANIRHYWFMWQGLMEVAAELAQRSIAFTLIHGHPEKTLEILASQACVLITEKAYLKTPRQWRKNLLPNLATQYLEVETEVVVPVETTSPKEEYAAATIRKKITSQWSRYLHPYELPQYELSRSNRKAELTQEQESSLKILNRETIQSPHELAALLGLELEPAVSPVFQGGYSHCISHLEHFLNTKLQDFAQSRSDPAKQVQSNMSPYLHFGQISPVDIALRVKDYWNTEVLGGSAGGFTQQNQAIPQEPVEAFLEELIVRRELGFNFVYYNPFYDSFACLPQWARVTLEEHKSDFRPYTYALEELEQARTHDAYWNAAQREMIATGKMAGYMRMYWGKKILEWTPDPEKAFNLALYLNNKYFLDGRDPNSYAGVAWCFGKHDRPWNKRSIFGSVRYMNDKGLERKFAIKAYAQRWNEPDLFNEPSSLA